MSNKKYTICKECKHFRWTIGVSDDGRQAWASTCESPELVSRSDKKIICKKQNTDGNCSYYDARPWKINYVTGEKIYG